MRVLLNLRMGPSSLELVELPRGLDLGPRPLSAHGQTHGMSPAPDRAHIPQPLNVVLHYAPRVVLYRHGRQLGRQGRDRLRRDGAESGARVDRVFGHDALGKLRAETVEALECFLRDSVLLDGLRGWERKHSLERVTLTSFNSWKFTPNICTYMRLVGAIFV